MNPKDKPLAWRSSEVKTPPFSAQAQLEAGFLLRRLQKGERVSMPHSRPMPAIGHHCHELRINDEDKTWRMIYRIEGDAILILAVFEKKTSQTPGKVIDTCKLRLKDYDNAPK